MRALVLFFFLILFQNFVFAQDSLVLKTGERIPYTRMAVLEDQVEIKHEVTKEFHAFPYDAVYGYSEGMKEKTYFFKQNPETEGGNDYLVVRRLCVGNLSLFEGTGNNQSLYMEKGERLEKVFEVTESKSEKLQRLEILKSFVNDDAESMAYITASGFKFKWKEIETVVEYYNKRNFDEASSSSADVVGTVYLYRTQFQKTKDRIVIKMNGEDHDLYLEDFIMLEMPIDYASKLYLRDSNIRSTHVMSGELEEQYFEILYDAKTNTFRFDKKEGTELQYEFYKIRDKVGKKITHD
ncbi:hypothetical protein SAMN04488029_2071 [Reichenbachiella faecimaris]|uniref:Uncharacterized protein n=1 Tax=Reichenbachiella faecimaris TaxID=692418 RepID=A0A1W2GDF7_REIFA|nr:hypothetical protein [Reichenbachiella faecimaris]SMD34554.1 hypothetical protein SAMN04488029_2071 [Reichenbachiella faecimaris]